MTDLFLSYKAEDRARVAPLVQALETDGLSVWWDAHIGGGDEWRDTILRHLEAARAVVVVWSRRSVGPNGQFVRDEASRALKRGTYLPVRIDRVDPPLGFGETQALDLQGWKGDRGDARYQAVLAALKSRLGIKTRRPPAQEHREGLTRRTIVVSSGAVVAASVAGIGAWQFLRFGPAKADSIAVLPFANLSGDPRQGFFSDGIAEELRNALSRVAGLKVVGRTSSEAVRNDDAETAAKKLGVSSILTGSVRQSPSTIRVSAQLVDGSNGLERWSQNYDRAPGDVIKIQSDIAENVAKALTATLAVAARAAAAAGGTSSAAAQQLLLEAVARARTGQKEDNVAAQSSVNAALAIDPNYAEAYVLKGRLLNAYANYFGNEAELQPYRRRAMASVQKAQQITPGLASAHNALAEVYRGQLELRSAEREYKRAQELGAADADFARDYASFLVKIGRGEEALRLADRAIALDPLNSQSYQARFVVLMGSHRLADAVDFSKRVERGRPAMFDWPSYLVHALIGLGRFDEARKYLELRPPGSADRLTGEAALAGVAGDLPAVERVVDKLKASFGDAASYQYAEIYAQARQPEKAFGALDRAWAIRDSGLLGIKSDPLLEPLRKDPRFAELVRKIDFPG